MSDVSAGIAGSSAPVSGSLGRGQAALPRPLTSFIGREHELAAARQLLQTSSLLTLTGPGGSGKTRLCIELAARVANDYPDGVYFVPLAPLRDPELVAPSIAQRLGLHDSTDRPLIDHLAGHLAGRKLLIVLDNFEHLLGAASTVAELLRRTRNVRILVSSRSSLRLSGEQQCPVGPLTLPDQLALATPASLAACESVRLFSERAAAVVPGFAVDEHNAAAIAQIVARLDGLPLAIELAAARVKLLPPEAIINRLEHSLGLLVGGSRDLPDRQQTLRSTIAWSYDLLSEEARRLLAACSVFRGGATLELIESVCAAADIGMPVLGSLQELVDHSLLRHVQLSGSWRYMMLETIREFAVERLDELPEADRIHRAHAAACLALTRGAGRPLTLRADLIEQLEIEHHNVRAAIDWYRQHDLVSASHLAAGMSGFWSLRGYFTEGRERLAELLQTVDLNVSARMSALSGAGWLALDQGDHADAKRRLEECIELSRAQADTVAEGIALLGLCRSKVTTQQAAEAVADAEHATRLLTASGDQPGIALSLFYSGLVAMFTDQLDAACGLFTQCAALSAELGFPSVQARALQLLGIARLDLGDLDAAAAALRQGLPLTLEIGDRFVVPIGLSGFAGLAARAEQPREALRLAGAAVAYAETNEFTLPDVLHANLDRWLGPSRQNLGEATAAKLITEGREMPFPAVVARALAVEPGRVEPPAARGKLTRREAEVAALVARGRTNRDIADRLCLSVRTVEVHVDRILTKLGFHTRTQLAAWAHEEGLLAEIRSPGT
jgi:predicted ATPase/DNA-binding NarL/FixJ family response regulator